MAFQNKRSLKVRQDGRTLVASFQTANPPLIWKFDLERNHSFALALQGEDGDWELGVTSPKEEFHPVARFLSREDAEEAFSKTQQALLTKQSTIWRPIAFSLGAVIVFLLFVILLLLVGTGHSTNTETSLNEKPDATSSRSAPQFQNGVPMDADRVLKPPQ